MDQTTNAAITWSMANGLIGRGTTAASVAMASGNPAFVQGPSTTSAPTANVPTITADTTNGGFNISWTPPYGQTPYAVNLVYGAFEFPVVGGENALAEAFPTSFPYALMSAWVELKPDQSGFQQYVRNWNIVDDQEVWDGWQLTLSAPGVEASLNVMIGNGTYIVVAPAGLERHR